MISVASGAAPQEPAASYLPGARKRLLVVDDHPAVRISLRDVLEDQEDFEVVAAVATPRRLCHSPSASRSTWR